MLQNIRRGANASRQSLVMMVQVDLIDVPRFLSSSNMSGTSMRMPAHAPDTSLHHFLTARCAFVVCAHSTQDACRGSDGRIYTARRCGALLYIDLDHAEPRHGAVAPAERRVASTTSTTACTAVTRLALLWLLRPLECGLFVSGRGPMLGLDGTGVRTG